MDTILIDTRLYSLFSGAVQEALNITLMLGADGRSLRKHDDIPDVTFSDNGMPLFGSGTKRVNYTGSIIDTIDIKSLSTFRELAAYVATNARLKEYFSFTGRFDDQSEWWVFLMVLQAVDRYIHLFCRQDLDESLLRPMYEEIELALFQPKLPIDIVVPIPFIEFQFDELPVGDHATIWRMDVPFQQARIASLPSYSNDRRLSTNCSHALVLHNWEVANEHYLRAVYMGPTLSTNATDIIEAFFAALRIEFNAETGYAQVVARSVNWLGNMDADLPSVTSSVLRGYPQYLAFDSPQVLPVVTVESGSRLAGLFQQLTIDAKSNVALAVKRLNRALLREQEEDSILDATIAMEALLSPENSPEITHRLKLRMAALAKLSDTHSTKLQEILNNVPRIYEYRSSVIHGNPEPHKKREIYDRDKDVRIPAIQLALDYLKMAMAVLAKHPKYLDTKKIDSELLLGLLEQSEPS